MERYQPPYQPVVTDQQTERLGKISGHVAQILRVAFFLNEHKEAVGTSMEDPDYAKRGMQEAKKDRGLRDWGVSENEFKEGAAVYRDWMLAAQQNAFEGQIPEDFDPMHKALNVFLTGLEKFQENPATRVTEMWSAQADPNPVSWIREVYENPSDPGDTGSEIGDGESQIPNEEFLRLERAMGFMEERNRERKPAILHYLRLGEIVLAPLFRRSLN